MVMPFGLCITLKRYIINYLLVIVAEMNHQNIIRTYEVFHRYFYWPDMGKELQNYVKRRIRHQYIKSSNQRPQGFLQPLQIPNRKW